MPEFYITEDFTNTVEKIVSKKDLISLLAPANKKGKPQMGLPKFLTSNASPHDSNLYKKADSLFFYRHILKMRIRQWAQVKVLDFII